MTQEKLHVDNPSKKERENCITDNKTSGEDKQSHFQGELTCWWICWFREGIESQKKKKKLNNKKTKKKFEKSVRVSSGQGPGLNESSFGLCLLAAAVG